MVMVVIHVIVIECVIFVTILLMNYLRRILAVKMKN